VSDNLLKGSHIHKSQTAAGTSLVAVSFYAASQSIA